MSNPGPSNLGLTAVLLAFGVSSGALSCRNPEASRTTPAPDAGAVVAPRSSLARLELEQVAAPGLEARARVLAGRLSPLLQFPLQDRTKLENAEAYLYLAARGEKPEVVAAALDALWYTFANTPVPGRRLIGADFRRVVTERLKADQRSVVARALTAASLSLNRKGVDAELLAAVQAAGRGFDDAPARLALLGAIQFLPPSALPPELAQQLLGFLRPDAEAYLLARTAQVLSEVLPVGLAESQLATVRALLTHESPAVRAQSARLLRRQLQGGSREALVTLLADSSGLVRATAATELANLDDPSAIAQLQPLIADSAEAGEKLSGWTNMDTTPGSLSFVQTTVPTVSVAVQFAISRLAPDAPAPQPGVGKEAEQRAQANLPALRSWLGKRKTKPQPK